MPRPIETFAGCLFTVITLAWAPGASAQVDNANPNHAAIREYGRIERHGATATLVAAGSRPLDIAAATLSACLGISVSSEDPRYHYLGDLLDVTAPQWSAEHPLSHVYAARPGKVEITFPVLADGSPADTLKLLADTAHQANQRQPYAYKVYARTLPNKTIYSFVPTRTHDENGVLKAVAASLDTSVTIPPQTNQIANLASEMARQVSKSSGLQFSCCQSLVAGWPWGGKSITYRADHIPAREALEDLMLKDGSAEIYSLRCELLDQRFCFIDVFPVTDNRQAPNGECPAAGSDPR